MCPMDRVGFSQLLNYLFCSIFHKSENRYFLEGRRAQNAQKTVENAWLGLKPGVMFVTTGEYPNLLRQARLG